MFTGLVEACVPVRSLVREGRGGRLVVPPPAALDGPEPWRVDLGDSVAVSGACLTVAALEADGAMVFELSAETLERTWLGDLAGGRPVNLERALRLGDRLDGHMVSGHVDTVGRIAGVRDSGDGGRVFTFEVPDGFEHWLVDKGSVTIDGISLTVVEPVGRRFDVAVIPHTLARTHLGSAGPGQRVNLEADMVGKWVARLLPTRPSL